MKPTWILSALVVLLCSAAVWADESSDASRLAETLRDYRTYQADFSQLVMDEQGRTVQESRGALKAKRPGLFYWESEPPMSQYVVSDGQEVTVYDPDLEQVTVHDVDEKMASTPAMLLSGDVGDLAENYSVTRRKLGDSTVEYSLVPRNEDSLFLSLRMTFFGDELQEMRLEDSLGQRTLLNFRNVVLNGQVSDDIFTLSLPEDVDVIRDSG